MNIGLFSDFACAWQIYFPVAKSQAPPKYVKCWSSTRGADDTALKVHKKRVSREKLTKKWTHSGHSRCMRNTNLKIHNLLKWLRLGGAANNRCEAKSNFYMEFENISRSKYNNPSLYYRKWRKKSYLKEEQNNNHKYPHIFALGKFVIL